MTLKQSGTSNFLKDVKKNYELTLIALPSLVYIVIFCYIPLYGLILPFKDYKYTLGFFGSPWSGLKNFEYLFTSNQLFIITRNTVCMNLLFIVTGTAVTITLAILLYETGKKYVKIYQTAMFFPHFVSWVVVSYIVIGFLDMEHGILNNLLNKFGVEFIMWYAEPKYWVFILLIVKVWKGVGFGTIIYYSVLIGIDYEYYEAAIIDGASKFKQVIYISLPMLKPVMIIQIILAIGSIFYSDFGLFYNVPLDQTMLYPVTDVIDTYVYRAIRSLGDFGMASAAGFYQSVVGFILVLVTNFIVRKVDSENALF